MEDPIYKEGMLLGHAYLADDMIPIWQYAITDVAVSVICS